MGKTLQKLAGIVLGASIGLGGCAKDDITYVGISRQEVDAIMKDYRDYPKPNRPDNIEGWHSFYDNIKPTNYTKFEKEFLEKTKAHLEVCGENDSVGHGLPYCQGTLRNKLDSLRDGCNYSFIEGNHNQERNLVFIYHMDLISSPRKN